MAGKSIFLLSLTLAHWLNEEGVGSLALEAHEGGHGVVLLRGLWLQMQDSMLADK